MAKQVINNGETGSSVRTKLNENFTELYTDGDKVPYTGATADLDLGVYDVIATGGVFGIVTGLTLSALNYVVAHRNTGSAGTAGFLSGNDNALWSTQVEYWGGYEIVRINPTNFVALSIDSAKHVTVYGMFKTGVFTVATLPSANTSQGYRAYVTDSNAIASGNFGATVAGGGSNVVPVFSNGTNWIIA